MKKGILILLALCLFLSTGSATLATQDIEYPNAPAATIPVNSEIGEFVNTNPGPGEPLDPDRWLNISVPTAVAFYSTGDDHEDLTSADFPITNHSGRGVDVTVTGFRHTGDGDMNPIETLNLIPNIDDSVHSNTVGLVNASGIINNPNTLLMTIERVATAGGARTATFAFEGKASPVTSTVSPTFDLVLGFAVNANVDGEGTPGITIPENPGETFVDPETNVTWRVLEPANVEGRGGLGNALIITEQTVATTSHLAIIENTDNWFNNSDNVSNYLSSIALNTEVAPARGESTEAGTGQNTFILPQENTAGNGRAFSLSLVEANHYFVENADRATIGASDSWWLRSLNASGLGHFIGVSGNMGNGVITASRGLRPALWVSAE